MLEYLHSCAFTGYRPHRLPWEENENDAHCIDLKRRLKRAIEDACRNETEHFFCGMAQGSDLYFAELVLEVKKEWETITLEAVLPCLDQARDWLPAVRRRWERLTAAADFVTIIQKNYSSTCMMERNRYMVDHAARLIAVYDGRCTQRSGTAATVRYAMRRGIPIQYVPPIPPDTMPNTHRFKTEI